MNRLALVLGVAAVAACGGAVTNDGQTGDGGRDAASDSPGRICDATCAPSLLDPTAVGSALQATDSFAFYFTSAPALIRRSMKDGKTDSVAAATMALTNPSQLRLIDGFALWLADTDTERGVAFRCGLAPLAPVQRVAMEGAMSIASTGGRLFIGLENRIDVSALDGKDRSVAWSEVRNLVSMTAANGSVVWLERGTIAGAASLRIGRPGEFVSDVSNSLSLPAPFSFDGTDIVFANPERGASGVSVRKRAPGLDAPTTVATFDDAVVGVANDSAGIVVATAKGELFAVDADGRRRLTKASVAGPASSEALRVTPEYVLWVSTSGLWRVPRNCGCT